jgi:hypothetical protein
LQLVAVLVVAGVRDGPCEQNGTHPVGCFAGQAGITWL